MKMQHKGLVMKHLPFQLKNSIPYLYEQQYKQNPTVYAKFDVEDSDWSWLVLEYSQHQRLFYGMILPEQQLTYFTLDDLAKIQYEYGVEVQQDTNFKPKQLKELLCKMI
jgi:tellurite resistance-related uncharacterized protein